MPDYRVLPAGDTALVVEFGEQIDRQLSTWVLALARRLEESRLNGVIEIVPTIRSLIVHYEPLALSAATLTARIVELMRGLHSEEGLARHWHLPACYDARIAPDLHDVAARAGITPAQVVERHSGLTYHVYMLGFLPGMAYLGDVPDELAFPRMATPRLKVPAGSLAIATTLTCVYPVDTPAGWHLIGRSPVPFFERHPTVKTLLNPGDKVTFVPVSLREYDDLMAQAAAGTLRIEPVEEFVREEPAAEPKQRPFGAAA
ncbi:MAG TPA: 5-oxoprolinase subunit PxpB [Xanthobacteraceae bacterium]|nr:5-oxoprolinase subunit PxpB [Xanthobacteraceae bacterium]